ncbi:MAG: cyclic nucleotide-binding and patatin-like phospholipase domain-containing protein, partial [Spirochaetaceae bacterium]|nr:cyclic nucleotide-binding and patatin-like phospholipase domain-containing protein [Spirochaetaceae bacterium]
MIEDNGLPADAILRENRESLAMFESLDGGIVEDLARSMNRITLEAGETLFSQGDAADAMYFVQEGMLQAYAVGGDGSTALVGRMGPGSLVGEIALLMGGRRNATVKATERTTMARLAAEGVDAVVARNPDTTRGIIDVARKRLRRSQWLKILPAYLGEIDEGKYEFIEPRFEWVHVDRDETLFSKGDPADCMYILVHGLLHVVDEDTPGQERIIASISRGEIVGEMAILSGETRTATVRAIRDSDLVRLTKAGFEEIYEAYPGVSMAILRILVNRLKDRGRAPRRRGAVNIALVPAGPGVPLAEFAQRLHAALSASDRTALLNSAKVAAEFSSNPGIAQASDEDPRHLGLITWLEELESVNDFVLYESDAIPSPWTRRCLRQADQVLIVGRAGDDPKPGRIEGEWLLENESVTKAAQSLALIHPDGSKLPSGTMEWLTKRRAASHHHVRWDNEADFARLARIVSKRAVGLVLGGGGARGMAHLGVIRALEERGIPVDFIGGASIGAILGGAYAMGMDSECLTRLCKDSFQKHNPFSDVTIPIISLLRSRKIERAARAAYGDARIEDLWLGFFCVSTNLG